MLPLIDTHTHFDIEEYADIKPFACRACQNGVRHVVIIGLLAKYFDRMVAAQSKINALRLAPNAHLAFGLHPLYIQEQTERDLVALEGYLRNHSSIAIGEIGLDTYPKDLHEPSLLQKQRAFFVEQIKLAKKYQLPILLHIRKSHAEVLKILADQRYSAYNLGGIAHSFSGGEQEALAFVQRGFKLGITGQITNPNAKKLHRAVMAVFKKCGADAFVIETDSPDMMPLPCQHQGSLNEPANLPYVLVVLAELFGMDREILAHKLWQNSCQALQVDWKYDTSD